MNHIYRSIWSGALGVWMAVSEIAKGQGKRSSNRHKLLATGLLICSTSVLALPTGNQLVAGQAAVSIPNANSMQINQASQNAIINWQGFSVAPSEAVNIQQPNANAALLNRVVGQNASQIQGQLNANGQVYLVNPNGVLFSKTAQVDVGGLIATTHNITNADFLNGNHHFTQNGTTGTVDNQGTIKTPAGGVVALIGQRVNNSGTITTPKGTTALAAGKMVDLDFKGDGLVEVNVSVAALNAQINNKGAIQADGGRVILTAKAAGQLIDTVINQEGIIRAQGMVERNGEIILEGGYVAQTGTLDASGKTGGTVDINARAILDAGITNADGTVGKGGNINMNASDAIIQTAAANTHANAITTGGTVHLEAANSVYSSGKLSVTGEQGGTINAVSENRVVLAAANVDASGSQKGGLIRVGGDFHGANAKLPNAKTTIINGATKLKADGGEGNVVVWSDEKTDYYGGISANQAGNIEVSSKGTLTYAGSADAGVGGNLLLDPKNIIISATGGTASYELIDPHLAAGNQFGYNTALLGTTFGGVFTENGNIVVGSPGDSFAATNAGAAYLFNTTTGALLATLTGSSANDFVGGNINGITALTNGNYVVWSSGATTWGNGITGISGIVNSANSLMVGSSSLMAGGIVTPLSNGNYVVNNPYWNNGTITNAGSVTWGNGTTGVTGTVSTANSLVGSSANDKIGDQLGIITLTNGNYVVASPYWDNGTIADAGAATWGNGNGGTIGTINAGNSLIGTSDGDNVGTHLGSSGITALTNGNYVVTSPYWNNGTITKVGAATWGNGNIGISGTINSINSLIGSIIDNGVGIGIIPLNNGDYVVTSHYGTAIYGNGTTGISGTVTPNSSVVNFGYPNNNIATPTNSSYVVSSAVKAIWGVENSMANFTGLSNGNYVVARAAWNNEGLAYAGQVLIATPRDILFANGLGQTMTFNPSFITDTLASGTNVTLQANNDITLNTGADIIVNGNNGGNFTLQAGRNINLNASIRTANGDFTAIAGDPNAIATDRDSGTPTITLGLGATIDAGTGQVILAAIGDNFINNSGSTKPITASQWLIYSTDPSQDILNGMTADGTHYDQTYTRSTPSYANTGNWFLYSNPITSTTTTVESVKSVDTETVIKTVKQVNLVDLNFWLSQLTPLQLSTTFLHDYTERLRDNNEEVDTDFGQYKGDVYSLKTEHYDWRKEHKKHKNRYVNLLLNIENGGIKLPVDSATSVNPIKF